LVSVLFSVFLSFSMWAQLFLTWTPPITTDTRSPSLSLSHGAPFLARLRALRFNRTLGFCIRVCVRVRLALSAPRLFTVSRKLFTFLPAFYCVTVLCVSFWILVKTLGCVRCCEKEVRSKGPYVLLCVINDDPDGPSS
jgi:hypothetical protein